jgi:hypothetical protein
MTRNRKRRHSRRTASNQLLAISLLASLTLCLATAKYVTTNPKAQIGVILVTFVGTRYYRQIYRATTLVMSIGYGGVYAVYGLHPTTGEYTCVYIGMTTQEPWTDQDENLRWPRIEQHLFGSEYYGTPAKPWADTVTSWCFVYEFKHTVPSVVMWLERRCIRRFEPLYNYSGNLNNPYRIDKHTVNAQREDRERGVYTPEYVDAARSHKPMFALPTM